jgi:hypothetical protein
MVAKSDTFQEIYDIIMNLIYLMLLNYIYSARQIKINMKYKNHLTYMGPRIVKIF